MVSDKVRSVLALAGKRPVDLARLYETSSQSMNNKLYQNRFSAEDLIRIADFTGCRLAFVLPDGGELFFGMDDIRPKEEKAPDADAPEAGE